jgi:hypothetical protein
VVVVADIGLVVGIGLVVVAVGSRLVVVVVGIELVVGIAVVGIGALVGIVLVDTLELVAAGIGLVGRWELVEALKNIFIAKQSTFEFREESMFYRKLLAGGMVVDGMVDTWPHSASLMPGIGVLADLSFRLDKEQFSLSSDK